MSESKKPTEPADFPEEENEKAASASTTSKNESPAEEQPKENNNEPKNESTNMEIYHSHGGHHPKKIKDYLFEFFMLFLAITSGFFMENAREKHVERNKEQEYIVSLIRDVKADTTAIHQIIERNNKQMKGLDSLSNLLEKPIPNIKLEELYGLTFKYLNNYNGFNPQEITMTQLKNSGGLRLIENNSISDSLVVYYSKIEYYHELNVKLNYRFIEDNDKLEMEFFNYSPYRIKNKKFSLTDSGRLKELYNRSVVFNSNISWDNKWLAEVSNKGTSLLKYLEKEYNIKD